MQTVEDHSIRRSVRQDTFDLRDQLMSDDHAHMHADHTYPSDEEHSVLEDDSDTDDRDADYMEDDDGSSSLSIPNESIDFDMANVVKGDSLFLMDDSNSYWWLVRVLKTEEVGYIPAENIETPFERLARLNKHRNVDLASATHAEKQEIRDRLRDNLSSRAGSNHATPSPTPASAIAPAKRKASQEEEEEEDVEWDDEGYEDEDPELAEEQEERERAMQIDSRGGKVPSGPPLSMEPDDGMSWEDGAVEAMQGKPRPQVAQGMEIEERARRPQEQPVVQPLRTQTSHERLVVVQNEPSPVSPVSPSRTLDPAQATETRKLSMTPPVARGDDHLAQQAPSAVTPGPLLPSAIMQQQSEERKRTREEIEALEEAARKKVHLGGAGNGNRGKIISVVSTGEPSSAKAGGGRKLRKDRDREATTDDESGKEKDKKKKSGVFGGLFGRRKDKEKGKDRSDTGSATSVGSETTFSRESEESGRSVTQVQSPSSPEVASPVTVSARQQQQQAILLQQQQQQQQVQQQSVLKNSTDPKRAIQQVQQAQPQAQQQQPLQPQAGAPPSAIQAQLSQHASQLRQRDQQQQALYQQYLNRSPSTPPEAQPSYGLQSASAVMHGSASFVSSNSSASGLSGATSRPRPGSLVLSPTTMDGQGVGLPDLSVVRVFAGNHLQTEATFKTVLLNASTTASDLVRQAIQRFRLPTGEDEKDYYLSIKQVEGSSAALLPHERPLGVFESLVEAALELPKVKRSSVGSISSVASNLSMHPAIKKLSMNDFTDDSAVKFYLNRRSRGMDDNLGGDEGDDTLLAESVNDDDADSSRARSNYLSVSGAGANSMNADRFSSPSYKFALQLVIYPDDLPDDMVFDPLTEAIVFKHTLRNRPQSNTASSPGISQTQRRKVFVFPKNVTVAEVIELGLERFAVEVGGKERELSPSSKVIDAFPRPPTYRAVDKRDSKRRSVDSAQLLLGNAEDVQHDDPAFVLRRAIAYRTSSSRHRSSAPLDELALQHLRDSVASSSTGSDSTVGQSERQMSKLEIIAAQRAATRANQRAILSAQTNSARGLDVLLPGNAMIRSSRYEIDDRIRYSYVEPDGETYDISDIVEEEWRGEVGSQHQRTNSADDDLLHGVLARGKDGLGAKLDRVLSKIKHDKSGRAPTSQSTLDSMRSSSPSIYSTADGGTGSRTTTPTAHSQGRPSSATAVAIQRVASPASRLSSYRTASPGVSDTNSRSHTITPTSGRSKGTPHERQSSFTSAMSDYRTATPSTPPGFARHMPAKEERPRLVLPKNDFGLADMMAIIELRASLDNKIPELPPLDPVDEMLFGRQLDLISLHPEIRSIYASTLKQLEEMDEVLDELLQYAS
ncbi:hypothetical protein A0H81_13412 [Grifola frondosa]|uniref:Ras-associating domain-containing protein n=1 Tax=Grifola frondosa TaxID=5627 RepID=A0A1C7LP91_GRIFR|nr:hypothetical protein A0H81_13412 [Grifola frondosa]